MAHFCIPTKPANGGQARSRSGTLTRADENAHDFYTEVALLQDYISYTTGILPSIHSQLGKTSRPQLTRAGGWSGPTPFRVA